MNPLDPKTSKGLTMVAAYRAARLSQRPALRGALRQTALELRQSRARLRGADAGPPAAADAPEPLSDPSPVASDPANPVSVFAHLVSQAAERRQPAACDVSGRAPAPPDPAPPDPAPPDPAPPDLAPPDLAPPEPSVDPALAADADGATEPEPSHAPDHPAPEPAPFNDPPLAEIGFGPGMLIRLSQLGLHTTGDLAQADPRQLRAALGDISRLVDVETWISSARQTTRPAPRD